MNNANEITTRYNIIKTRHGYEVATFSCGRYLGVRSLPGCATVRAALSEIRDHHARNHAGETADATVRARRKSGGFGCGAWHALGVLS